MTSRLARPARGAAVLLAAAVVMVCAATALAAVPVRGGAYRGSTSDGGKVALRVVNAGARLHWQVDYRSASCTPRGLTSRAGSTFDRRGGTPLHSDGSYREDLRTNNKTTFNGHGGYRDKIHAVFRGAFVTRHTATGRFEQRESFYRPNGSRLATCLRKLTYRATLR